MGAKGKKEGETANGESLRAHQSKDGRWQRFGRLLTELPKIALEDVECLLA